MPCEHAGPVEVMQMAEELLRQRGVPAEQWPGTRAVFGENTPGTMWESVVTGIERRGDQWIVVKLDRRKEPLPASEVGLRVSSGTGTRHEA